MTRAEQDADRVTVSSWNSDAFVERMNVAISRAGGVTNMAKQIGASASVVRKWRSGKSEPVTSFAVAMAEAADVPLEWLATGEGSPDGGVSEPSPPRYGNHPVNLELLEQLIYLFRKGLVERRLQLDPAAEARAIRALYQIHVDRDDPPKEETVAEVLHLAAHR